MSNKLIKENKNINAEEKNDKNGLDTASKWILGGLGACIIGLFGFSIYWGYSGEVAEREFYETLYGVTAPDFSTLEASPSAEEIPTTKVDGTIGFDAFYELRREKTKEGLEKIKGVIGDELYIDYLNGLDTDYYKKSVEYDYNDMLNDMDGVLEEAGVIEALYNFYAETNDMPEYEECMEEDCSLLNFINDYTREDLHDFLKTRHDMWESIIEVEASRTNLDDSYLNLFYQDMICNDVSYLEDISVEVILLNKATFDLGADVLQSAYDAGHLKSKIITQDTMSYISNFDLYKDIDFYDDGFRDLAVDAFQAQFANDVVQESIYLGDVGSASSDNQTLVDKLKGMGAPSNEEVIDYTKLENWHVESLSLASRSEDDILYMLWKVVPGSVKHVDNIPSKDSLIEGIEKEAKMYLASRVISDTIYAELNELTEGEVHDLLKENYGYTDEELGALTEEEMREYLAVEQEKEELEAQENLNQIIEHMEEHGYDLTGLSDEEIVEYYIETHQEELNESHTHE